MRSYQTIFANAFYCLFPVWACLQTHGNFHLNPTSYLCKSRISAKYTASNTALYLIERWGRNERINLNESQNYAKTVCLGLCAWQWFESQPNTLIEVTHAINATFFIFSKETSEFTIYLGADCLLFLCQIRSFIIHLMRETKNETKGGNGKVAINHSNFLVSFYWMCSGSKTKRFILSGWRK